MSERQDPTHPWEGVDLDTGVKGYAIFHRWEGNHPSGVTGRDDCPWLRVYASKTSCVGTCGRRRKGSHFRSLTPTRRNSPSLCTIDI